MLPPGHIAAGYLTAYALIKITGYNLTPTQIDQLLLMGAVIGFIPDLDIFTAFAKIRGFRIELDKADHRHYLTHAPILWLAAGLLILFLSVDPFLKTFGLLVWLASWSHFFMDTLQYGIMWFWPFSKRLFAFKDRENVITNSISKKRGFIRYWLSFVWAYMTKEKLTFAVEIILLLTAAFILFK
jgi:hypothetical protein